MAGQEFVVATTRKTEILDITDRVSEILASSGTSDGIVLIFCRHTTAAILVNENEPGLLRDLAEFLEKLAPSGASYRHDNFAHRKNVCIDEPANGHAHIRSTVLLPSVALPAANGSLGLGTWQRVFLAELDGPRRRTVSVTIAGAK